MTVKRMIVFLAALVLILPGSVFSLDWVEDQTTLNPTGFPWPSNSYKIWTVGEFGDFYGVCWIGVNEDGFLERVIPDYGIDDLVFGWTVDAEFFDGVVVPTSLREIKVGNWDPDVEGNEVMLLTWQGEMTFFHNMGSAFVPDWEAMNNPFEDIIIPDNLFTLDVGYIDHDDLSDVVFGYDMFLYHYEWNGATWVQEDTLMVFEQRMPFAVQLYDLDNDQDSDIILTSDRPCQWLSYEVIENQSTINEIQFGDFVQLPTWLGYQVAADMTGDGTVEMIFMNGFQEPDNEDPFLWKDPLWFNLNQTEFFALNDENETINFAHRIRYYQTPGVHEVFISGEINGMGWQTNDWCGDIFNSVSPEWLVSHGMAFDDFNGDEVKDLVYHNADNDLKKLRNEGTDLAPVWVEDPSIFYFETPSEVTAFSFKNIDGSGLKDVILQVDNEVHLYQGLYGGGWGRKESWEAALPLIGYQPFAFGDFDGDGDCDLVVNSTEESSFYMNVGEGGEPEWQYIPNPFPVTERSWAWPMFFDFDDDGREDLQIGEKIYLSRNSSGVNTQTALPTEFSVGINPNPFNAMTTVKMSIPSAGNYNVVLFDLLGRKVQTLMDKPLTRGQMSFSINGESLASGSYYLTISGPNVNTTQKVTLLK